MTQKNMSFNSWDLDLYDYTKITFIHPVINAQWHAKVGLPVLFFIYPVYKGEVGTDIPSDRGGYTRQKAGFHSG